MTDDRKAFHEARMRHLSAWLERRNARKLWQTRVPQIGNVTAHSINGRVAISIEFDSDAGWDLYVPASNSTGVETTIEDAERALGITAPLASAPGGCMTVGTLRRMLAESKLDDSLPIHVHVTSEQGWMVSPLLPQLGRAGETFDTPVAAMLALETGASWEPYDTGDLPGQRSATLADEVGPARFRNEAGQLVEDDWVPEEDR